MTGDYRRVIGREIWQNRDEAARCVNTYTASDRRSFYRNERG